MILWAILILNAAFAMMTLALSGANDALMRQVQDASRDNPLHVTRLAGCLLALFPMATTALWTVYAVQVHDWRFAAISGVPMAAGILRRIVAGSGPRGELRTTQPARVVRR